MGEWVVVYGVYTYAFYLTSRKNIRMPKLYRRMYNIALLTDTYLTVYFNSIGEWVLDFPIEIETATLNSGLTLGTWRRAL